ncbi:hypothetical protein PSACC_02114 [Paramicrosporidium saccamoebae]|uniref:Uncharacterized protein n=1 Tax=Paramicrosporidium saccamoebae TaxID=1246581 RepID=A0A2H9TJZ3_9FUNG|nr:hypothetical protein PSACC_02114 [Paramicrosporidium saccamoebae]
MPRPGLTATLKDFPSIIINGRSAPSKGRGEYRSVRRAASHKIKVPLIDSSISGDAKPAKNSATLGSPLSKNTTESIEKLIEMGRTLKRDPPPTHPLEFLYLLNFILEERRATAGSNSDLIAKHYSDAAAILTECPVIPNAEIVAQEAFSETEKAIQ